MSDWKLESIGPYLSHDLSYESYSTFVLCSPEAIAKCYGKTEAQAKNRGHLISAANDLYEALTELMKYSDPVEDEEWNRYMRARRDAVAALKKAEGKA